MGPKVGDLLIDFYNVDGYVYGCSSRPVNGVNYQKYVEHIKTHHPHSIIIAVDACLGEKDDVGKVKYALRGLKAGAALNKNLTEIGDLGILGVVAERSKNNLSSLIHADGEVVETVAENVAKKVFSIVKNLNLAYSLRHIMDGTR